MATSGPNYPGTVSATGWTNPTYIQADDTNYAAQSQDDAYFSATNFGFSLTGVITGITVEIAAYCNNGTGSFDTVQLIKGGTAQGNNKGADNSFPQSPNITNRSFGGTSDLWGLTFTAAEVNAANFGVYVYVIGTDNWMDAVDYVRVTITYTPYIDSGIRYYDGAVKSIAAETLTASHKLRFNKGGTIVGLPLVATTDTTASKIRIYDGSAVKSLALYA